MALAHGHRTVRFTHHQLEREPGYVLDVLLKVGAHCMTAIDRMPEASIDRSVRVCLAGVDCQWVRTVLRRDATVSVRFCLAGAGSVALEGEGSEGGQEGRNWTGGGRRVGGGGA